MKIVLADDYANICSAIKLILEEDDVFQVVGEADDLDQLLLLIEDAQPDILLLDWELIPGQSEALIRTINKAFPQLFVTAMSARSTAKQEAMQAGVDAFISKGEPSKRFLSALHVMREKQMNVEGRGKAVGRYAKEN
ncbi:MAG: response regulator [Anaerolineales bacterium]|nr:response regulator [Anaerolineales bacterium]